MVYIDERFGNVFVFYEIKHCLQVFMSVSLSKYEVFIFILPFFFFLNLFRAIPMAYGGSQARGRIGAVAASLCHSHSNAGSKPLL